MLRKRMWQKGERLFAEVVEKQREFSYLCSIEGQLIRVNNRSGNSYQVGQRIQLVVLSADPLEFKVADKVGRGLSCLG